MTVLAVMTNLSDILCGSLAANSRGTAIQMSSAGGAYDTAFATGGILFQREVAEPYLDLKSNKTDFWLHFDWYADTTGSSGDTIEFRSASGTLQLSISVTSSFNFAFQKSTDGVSGSGILSGTGFTLGTSTRSVYDIRISLGSSGEIKLYKDGSLVFTYTGDLTTNGDNAIRYVTWRGTDVRAHTQYISQVVADTGSTVGFKVFNTEPINSSIFTDWTGNISQNNGIGTYNAETPGTYTNTVGHKVSWTGVALPAGSIGMAVRAIVNSVRAYATANAVPQSIAPGMRFSTTNYEGNTFSVDPLQGIKVCQHIWNQNPQTGLAWTYSEANSAAFTYIAKT